MAPLYEASQAAAAWPALNLESPSDAPSLPVADGRAPGAVFTVLFSAELCINMYVSGRDFFWTRSDLCDRNLPAWFNLVDFGVVLVSVLSFGLSGKPWHVHTCCREVER